MCVVELPPNYRCGVPARALPIRLIDVEFAVHAGVCAGQGESAILPGMSTFDERLAVGNAHERRVATELEARGWLVTEWGQGMLPAPTRWAIREARSQFRFFPDMIASRAHGEVIAIDAKDCMRSTETGRYAISRDCVAFGLQFFAAFGIPLFYVCGSNLGTFTPTEIASYGQVGPRATNGAYYLISIHFGRVFDDIFGTPRQQDAA